MKKYIIALAAMAAMVTSCGDSNKFSVKGNIAEAGNETMWFQGAVNGRWITIDSVKINSKGDFKYSRTAPHSPEVYRLVLGDKAVYFPIDSLENIELNSNKVGFGVDYTLSGSEDAVNMMNVDKKVRELYGADEATVEAYKVGLVKQILINPSSIVSYYILNKHIGDKPLFDPNVKADNKVYGAVANAYYSQKPNDPRTALLVNTFISNRKVPVKEISAADTLYATEAQILEINLPDETGKKCSLAEVAGKGNVVLLNFTAMTADESPAYNKLLSDIYNKYKSRGFEIYQVGLDGNISKWKMASQNIPWITVYDESGIKSINLVHYNVGMLPMSYIINRKGEIVERVVDQAQLLKAIAKHI